MLPTRAVLYTVIGIVKSDLTTEVHFKMSTVVGEIPSDVIN